MYLTALFAYGLFDRLYVNWLVWQNGLPYGSGGFWDVQLGLVPIVFGETLAVVAGAAMLVWNFRSRTKPATEVTYLFWVGLAIMAYFGPQLVVGLTYLTLNGGLGGWPFEMWLQPAVPFLVGAVMMLSALSMTLSQRKPSPVAAAN